MAQDWSVYLTRPTKTQSLTFLVTKSLRANEECVRNWKLPWQLWPNGFGARTRSFFFGQSQRKSFLSKNPRKRQSQKLRERKRERWKEIDRKRASHTIQMSIKLFQICLFNETLLRTRLRTTPPVNICANIRTTFSHWAKLERRSSSFFLFCGWRWGNLLVAHGATKVFFLCSTKQLIESQQTKIRPRDTTECVAKVIAEMMIVFLDFTLGHGGGLWVRRFHVKKPLALSKNIFSAWTTWSLISFCWTPPPSSHLKLIKNSKFPTWNHLCSEHVNTTLSPHASTLWCIEEIFLCRG